MNNVLITDQNFLNSDIYKNFINENKGKGRLLVRAYSANEAIPISNLKIKISLNLDNYNVIFFDGTTDESGMIPTLLLPAPIYNEDNLIAPLFTTYNLEAFYNNKNYVYKVNLYDNICVIQNINVTPEVFERN